MAFIITRLPGEPIVIAGFDLPLSQHLPDLKAFTAQCARIVDEVDGPLYRIINLVTPQIDYSDVLLFLNDIRQQRPGSTTDPRMRTVAVGTHPMIAIGVRQIRTQFGLEIPIFATLGEALDYVRWAVRVA